MDSLTTVLQMTSNCSCLFPDPPPTPTLKRASHNVWQTSLLGQLRITSNSTLVKLNSSSSRRKTALASTCKLLSRMSEIAFIGGEEPGHNPRRRTLPPQHQCCGPILQICPLHHPQDLVFPHKRHSATPGPSASHLPPGLLQLLLG